MTAGPDWVPPGIDTGKANIARVYDCWLGGTSNFLADQGAARALLALEPNARGFARANRAFLGRAVRYLAGQEGIRQFLDIGSGIPTAGNVHEVAQETAPGCHVVYADVDEVVIAHSKLLLKDQPDTVAIQADLRKPEKDPGRPRGSGDDRLRPAGGAAAGRGAALHPGRGRPLAARGHPARSAGSR